MAYNFGQGLQGGAAGAGAGSAGGPQGAAIGGLLGLLAGFGGGGKDAKLSKIDTMTPEQQQHLQQLLQMLSSEGQLGQGYEGGLQQLMELMDPSSEAQQRFADPYMQQFQQETIPGLAERFAGAGATGGALSSSGFGQALGGAAGGLQTQLAALKSQIQRGAIQDILGQYQQTSGSALSAQPFGYYQQPGQQGLGSSMLQGYAGAGFPSLSNLFGSKSSNFGSPAAGPGRVG